MATSRTRDKVGGAMQFIKGRIRERWGQRSGNLRHETGGQKEQVKGGFRNKKGHAKDLVK
jgi:uncharacterized protein YjbJ (UPF0337 family)